MTTTPMYQQTVEHQAWSPADLRPPLDLDDWIARSYEKAIVRNHLRHQIARRAQVKKHRRRRAVALP